MVLDYALLLDLYGTKMMLLSHWNNAYLLWNLQALVTLLWSSHISSITLLVCRNSFSPELRLLLDFCYYLSFYLLFFKKDIMNNMALSIYNFLKQTISSKCTFPL